MADIELNVLDPVGQAVIEVIGKPKGLVTVGPKFVNEAVDYRHVFSWEISSNSEGESKQSKNLMVTIASDAIQNYLEATKELKSDLIKGIKKILEAELQKFDPDYDESEEASPPVETITICGNDLKEVN